jgi:hypothetical protein
MGANKFEDSNSSRSIFVEYLSKLKSPYAEQAIENYSAKFTEDIDISLINDVEGALMFSFDWNITPQGNEYWCKVYIHIEEYLK